MTIGKDRGNRYFLSSVTRNTDLSTGEFQIEPLDRLHWAEGDFIAAKITGESSDLYTIELSNGRIVTVMEGDLTIGAFGKREATLEGVGDWREIGDDGALHALTGAGLFGKATSRSPLLPRMMSMTYVGHVLRAGRKQTMNDFIVPVADQKLEAPVVLLVGTSMSAGKTTAGRVIIHELKKSGLSVVGAKLTGAARFRDILTYGDAGADAILDFVDAGLPSTVVSRKRFLEAMRYMRSRIAEMKPDVVVAEAGASPLEPYNGDVAIDTLGNNVRFVVLCASDPYAVVGVQTAFGIRPDLVTGPAANTSAGIQLVKELTGLTALSLIDPASLPDLRVLLQKALHLTV